MNRRQFFRTGTGVALAAGGISTSTATSATAAARVVPPPFRMKLGTFVEHVDDASMNAVLRWGIRNIYARATIADPERMYPTLEEISRMRETADRNGVSVDILRPRNLAMTNIDVEKYPAIMLGDSPQRDRDIEGFQQLIRNCAKAGIPAIRYTLSIVGNQRTGNEPGRGDAIYRTSRMADFRRDAPLTRAGRVDEAMYWERIRYFLERVVPVAGEYKVRLLSHMEDAMTPAEGYRGLSPVTNTVEGAKQFVSIAESSYHGLLFCIGTFAEMLQQPTRDFYDVMRYFGERQKIFMVDFRNIRGNRQQFAETFPDDGELDMLRAMRILRDVGFDGMVCPDHQPQTPGGPDQVNAFQYGYIRGLMHAVERTG